MASKILVNEITHTDSTSDVVIPKISSTDTVITNTIKLAEIPNSTRDALTPTNGMMIYNSTSNEIQIYVNGSWVKVTTGAVTS